jgi:hypothetical protein
VTAISWLAEGKMNSGRRFIDLVREVFEHKKRKKNFFWRGFQQKSFSFPVVKHLPDKKVGNGGKRQNPSRPP